MTSMNKDNVHGLGVSLFKDDKNKGKELQDKTMSDKQWTDSDQQLGGWRGGGGGGGG